jgi:Ca2+-binding EF-hand superfamily protein
LLTLNRFDFDNDGKISKEDVKMMLSYLEFNRITVRYSDINKEENVSRTVMRVI